MTNECIRVFPMGIVGDVANLHTDVGEASSITGDTQTKCFSNEDLKRLTGGLKIKLTSLLALPRNARNDAIMAKVKEQASLDALKKKLGQADRAGAVIVDCLSKRSGVETAITKSIAGENVSCNIESGYNAYSYSVGQESALSLADAVGLDISGAVLRRIGNDPASYYTKDIKAHMDKYLEDASVEELQNMFARNEDNIRGIVLPVLFKRSSNKALDSVEKYFENVSETSPLSGIAHLTLVHGGAKGQSLIVDQFDRWVRSNFQNNTLIYLAIELVDMGLVKDAAQVGKLVARFNSKDFTEVVVKKLSVEERRSIVENATKDNKLSPAYVSLLPKSEQIASFEKLTATEKIKYVDDFNNARTIDDLVKFAETIYKAIEAVQPEITPANSEAINSKIRAVSLSIISSVTNVVYDGSVQILANVKRGELAVAVKKVLPLLTNVRVFGEYDTAVWEEFNKQDRRNLQMQGLKSLRERTVSRDSLEDFYVGVSKLLLDGERDCNSCAINTFEIMSDHLAETLTRLSAQPKADKSKHASKLNVLIRVVASVINSVFERGDKTTGLKNLEKLENISTKFKPLLDDLKLSTDLEALLYDLKGKI